MDSSHRIPKAILASLLAGGLLLSGCKTNEAKPADSNTQQSETKAQSTEAPAPAAQPAPAAAQKPICKDEPAKKTSKKKKGKAAKTSEPVDCVPASEAAATPPPPPPPPTAVAAAPTATGGYDLSKNKPVTDSTKAESGQGTMVKGVNDWEGEISGIPAANSRFVRLRIGMPLQQVIDLLGQPTEQGSHMTGKAFIPFYHGSDKVRYEAVYQGQGRLIFSNQAGWGGSGEFYLTWIIHNAKEPGYR
jgi:hypothetical protein